MKMDYENCGDFDKGKLRAYTAMWEDKVHINWCFYDIKNRKRYRVSAVTLEEWPELVEVKPLMSLEHVEAVELVTRLWDAGIRPAHARDINPEVAAIKYHLEDMRKLCFNTITE